VSRSPSERLAVLEQKVSHMEEELARMSSKVDDIREQCCDCGLIHRLDFRIVDGRIEFRARRDDRATAAARRKFRFAPEE
jgi:hypothetical protein